MSVPLDRAADAIREKAGPTRNDYSRMYACAALEAALDVGEIREAIAIGYKAYCEMGKAGVRRPHYWEYLAETIRARLLREEPGS